MNLKKLSSHPNGNRSGVQSNLMVTAEYAAAAFAFGYIQNAYPDKARIYGVPTDLGVGVAAKAASMFVTLLGKGGVLGKARPHLDIVGNAGIAAYFHTLGAGHGFKKSGRVRAILPAGSEAAVQKAVPAATIMGVAANTQPKDLLSASDLAKLARGK
jgi:hypothetical protein